MINLLSPRLPAALITIAALACFVGPVFAEQLNGSARDAQRWNFFLREHEIDQLWRDVSARTYPQSYAIEHVKLVAMIDDQIQHDMTVVVQNGLIEAVGPSAGVAVPENALRIDGTGKYLTPGLTDMHVHNLVSNSQVMLNLANGVTSVRDMDGFKWMLALRRRIAEGQLLAPTMYISGHILSGFPMQFYATLVQTPRAARLAVRDQAAAGYDFIKVHNSMSPEVFAAVIDEARGLGLDVVGHIPHGISIADAVAGDMRTLEHFKGYILDSTLSLTDEDYLDVTRGQEIWNTPTFYVNRAQLRGDEARRQVLDSEEIHYVSPSDVLDWQRLALTPSDQLNELRKGVFNLSQKIFRDLLTIDAQFLAGTDSGGGTPMLIPGFALHDELRIIQDNGLSPFETLRTATTNAAEAMRLSTDFGSIEAGKRADLLLLDNNPLETVENLGSIHGVSANGRWLDHTVLAGMLAGIRDIYALKPGEDLENFPDLAAVDVMLKEKVEMRGRGFIFRDFDLGEISRLLRTSGLNDRSGQVRALRSR